MCSTSFDDELMVKFMAEKARFASCPLTNTTVWREYRQLNKIEEIAERTIYKKFQKLRNKLHTFDCLDTYTKIRTMFAFRAPVDKDFLETIRKSADILEVNEMGHIVKYKKGNFVLFDKRTEVKRKSSSEGVRHDVKKAKKEEEKMQMIEVNELKVKTEPVEPMVVEVPCIDDKSILILLRRVIIFLESPLFNNLLEKVQQSIKFCNNKSIPIDVAVLAINNIFTGAHSSIDDGAEKTSLKYFLKQLKCNILDLEGSGFSELLKSIENEIQKDENKQIPVSNILMALETAYTLVHNGAYF